MRRLNLFLCGLVLCIGVSAPQLIRPLGSRQRPLGSRQRFGLLKQIFRVPRPTPLESLFPNANFYSEASGAQLDPLEGPGPYQTWIPKPAPPEPVLLPETDFSEPPVAPLDSGRYWVRHRAIAHQEGPGRKGGSRRLRAPATDLFRPRYGAGVPRRAPASRRTSAPSEIVEVHHHHHHFYPSEPEPGNATADHRLVTSRPTTHVIHKVSVRTRPTKSESRQQRKKPTKNEPRVPDV